MHDETHRIQVGPLLHCHERGVLQAEVGAPLVLLLQVCGAEGVEGPLVRVACPIGHELAVHAGVAIVRVGRCAVHLVAHEVEHCVKELAGLLDGRGDSGAGVHGRLELLLVVVDERDVRAGEVRAASVHRQVPEPHPPKLVSEAAWP